MHDIQLAEITEKNWEQICCLHPGQEGARYVASNAYSIVQSFYEKEWIIRAITAGEQLVGFAMYGYSSELAGYELCRFMIDQHFQGKGYGQLALQAIVQEMMSLFCCKKSTSAPILKMTGAGMCMRNMAFVPPVRCVVTGMTWRKCFALTVHKLHNARELFLKIWFSAFTEAGK